MHLILSREQMAAAEKLAIVGGRDRTGLVEIASRACSAEIVRRWPGAEVIVLCGPGGNGLDGLVIAARLAEIGRTVQVLYFGDETPELAEKVAGTGWTGAVNIVDEGFDGHFSNVFDGVGEGFVVVDALYGLGLNRSVEGKAVELIDVVNALDIPVLSVDIPSGLGADSADVSNAHIVADVTVTFEALKPVHILEPAASACGEIVIARLNLGEEMIACTGAPDQLNDAPLWRDLLPWPKRADHKHKRGRVAVVSGPATSTGAARMAALACLRTGAGVVTLLGENDAMRVLANTNMEVMLRGYSDPSELIDLVVDKDVVVVGPAAGVNVATRQCVLSSLRAGKKVVIDADAISVFSEDPRTLMESLHPECVLTPHAGEFARIFPGVLEGAKNRIEAVRQAQVRAGCTILLKGADTIIASAPDRVRVNVHSGPWLATAGAGDVLAGMVGGLMAQGMSAFEAASAAAWMHGDASLRRGPGLIAGDLVDAIPDVLKSLYPSPAKGRADRSRKIIGLSQS